MNEQAKQPQKITFAAFDKNNRMHMSVTVLDTPKQIADAMRFFENNYPGERVFRKIAS